MKRSEIYEEVSLKRGKGVKIKRSLCFYNPFEVYEALISNSEVKKWLEFISTHYEPPKAKILLIYPCTAEKPYYESRSYKKLFATLSKLGERRKEIHLMTISEPFGLIPEEFYGVETPWHDWKNSWYDCPGLFEWWCRKHSQPYSSEYLEKCIEILAMHIAKFLMKAKTKKIYSKIIGFVRTYSSNLEIKKDYTHRRILDRASQIAKINIKLLPPKDIVNKIVISKGRFAWDMYGVSHPIAQNYLLNYLKKAIRC